MSKHQLLNGEVFLQADLLSLCQNAYGSLGGVTNAPAGFRTDTKDGYVRVGLEVNLPGLAKEAMLEGTPDEGPVIGYSVDGRAIVHNNCARAGHATIPGVSTDLSTDSLLAAGWKGQTAEGLAIAQTRSFADGDKAIRVIVALTNTSAKTLADLRYVETFDPDQGKSFETVNHIERQGAGGAVIAAYASSKLDLPAFLATDDPRAAASAIAGYDSPSPLDPVLWAKAAVGPTTSGDSIICLGYALGDLKPGETTTLAYLIGVTDNLAASLATIDHAVAPEPAPVQVSPPPPAPPAPPAPVSPPPPPPPPSSAKEVFSKTFIKEGSTKGQVRISTASIAKGLGIPTNTILLFPPRQADSGYYYTVKA